MATRILGIDLGAYSVKVLIANQGFRTANVLDFVEKPVPEGDAPFEERAIRTLGEIVRAYKLEHESAFASVSGDKLFIHIVELPFRNLRRPELEKAVGAELEGILPIDLEDMVFGFEALPGLPSAAALPASGQAGPGDPQADEDVTQIRSGLPGPGQGSQLHGRVAPPIEGMRVLACTMEVARARSLIELMGTHALEPRGLIAAPASYARLIDKLVQVGDAAYAAPVVVIDIGHSGTDVCVVASGRAVYTRTIAHGGRDVTTAISRYWGVSYEDAEAAKHTGGFIGSSALPASHNLRMHDAVVTAVDPLAKEIKRTLMSCRAKTGFMAGRAIVVGGGSRLSGLPEFLSEKLRVPVARLSDAEALTLMGPGFGATGRADIACLALGLALEGATPRPSFDLRQGELAYKADLSFLRQKVVYLATVGLLIVGFAAVNGYASLYKLRAAERNLSQRLALETEELFGAQLGAEEALARTQGKVSSQVSPLPKMTAYDILIEINQALPDRGSVALDVRNVDIKPGKIIMQASAKSNAEIDQIEEKLKKITCFTEVNRGSVSAGVDDVRDFSFTITSTCMGGQQQQQQQQQQ